MKVTVVDPVTSAAWRRLVTEHATTLFHSPAWLRVLADTYGFPVKARVVSDDAGRPVAGMPYVTVQDFMDRRTLLPFSDFCDPLVDDAAQWRALTDELFASRQRIDLRCVHNDVPLADDRFTVVDRALWHCIDVERDEDEIWSGLSGSARRALRKAHKGGVTVEPAQDEADLRAFFDLHLQVRKHKYRLLAQPYRFLKNIWDAFVARDRGTLLLATLDGRVIAGVMFLEWQDVLYYKFNASDGAHLDARPNDLVLWEGVRHAQKRGLHGIDFGLTDADQEGLIRYKRKYATDEKIVTMLRHQPAGTPTEADQLARRALGDVTRLLTDPSVPDDVSEQAGDVFYRYFT